MTTQKLFPFFKVIGLMFALASCGFTPVYAPGSQIGQSMSGIELAEPNSQNGYLFVRAMEAHLARPANADKVLRYRVSVVHEGVESDSNRRRVVGTATYRLHEIGTNKLIATGAVNSFAGYSVSDGLFAGARQDAIERLIKILADQTIRDLIVKLPTQ